MRLPCPGPTTAPLAGPLPVLPPSFLSQNPRRTQTDVAIVGGGAMGCAIAYVFAAAGIKVRLLEKGRIAGAGGHGAGYRAARARAHFHKLAKQHGVRDARHIYQTARRGSLEYLSALRRLRIECGLQVRDASISARRPKASSGFKRNTPPGASGTRGRRAQRRGAVAADGDERFRSDVAR